MGKLLNILSMLVIFICGRGLFRYTFITPVNSEGQSITLWRLENLIQVHDWKL